MLKKRSFVAHRFMWLSSRFFDRNCFPQTSQSNFILLCMIKWMRKYFSYPKAAPQISQTAIFASCLCLLWLLKWKIQINFKLQKYFLKLRTWVQPAWKKAFRSRRIGNSWPSGAFSGCEASGSYQKWIPCYIPSTEPSASLCACARHANEVDSPSWSQNRISSTSRVQGNACEGEPIENVCWGRRCRKHRRRSCWSSSGRSRSVFSLVS